MEAQVTQFPMRRLFQYLKKYRGNFWFATLSSITNKVADLTPPLLTKWMIDVVSGTIPFWIVAILGTSDQWSAVIFVTVLIVVLFGAESLFEWMYQKGFMRLAQKVQHDLRVDAYRKLQKREVAYFETQRTGNLMSILNDDINQLERFLNDSFNQIVQLVTLFIFAGIALALVSWELALIGMIPMPFILIGSFYYQKMISPHYQNIRESVGSLSNRLENNISGILVVKSFTAEEFEAERVEESSKQYREMNYGAIKYSAIFVPIIRIFITLGFAAVLMVGAYWILIDNGKFSAGSMAMFAMMIQRLLWPVTRLGRIFDDYERARASSRRVFDLMDTPSKIQNPSHPKTINAAEGNIVFDEVKFKYNDGPPVLKGLTLTIPTGKRIGIAGTTGAGKTTLIKLLLRLYDVTGGSIKIGNEDIRNLKVEDLRKSIALVSQDVYLFHGSIYDNIAYGMADATLEQVQDAAQKAQLHDFVMTLSEGYHAIVGERGIKLSGGQRQRLSIARAILKNAPILILDEATSSVDTETERAIQESLNQLTMGKTALIIAHRLSTIRHADKIIILNEGQVFEEGSHEELLSKKGLYADLWNVQIGEI